MVTQGLDDSAARLHKLLHVRWLGAGLCEGLADLAQARKVRVQVLVLAPQDRKWAQIARQEIFQRRKKNFFLFPDVRDQAVGEAVREAGECLGVVVCPALDVGRLRRDGRGKKLPGSQQHLERSKTPLDFSMILEQVL